MFAPKPKINVRNPKLVTDVATCTRCRLIWDGTVILEREKEELARIVKESYRIELSQRWGSAASVVFGSAEKSLIGLRCSILSVGDWFWM